MTAAEVFWLVLIAFFAILVSAIVVGLFGLLKLILKIRSMEGEK